METDQLRFLSLPRLPARLNAEQTAWILGFNSHDIPILIVAGYLKQLGSPPPTGSKYFAADELEELREPRWLHGATLAIQDYWR